MYSFRVWAPRALPAGRAEQVRFRPRRMAALGPAISAAAWEGYQLPAASQYLASNEAALARPLAASDSSGNGAAAAAADS